MIPEVSARAHTDFPVRGVFSHPPARSDRFYRFERPFVWYALSGLEGQSLQFDPLTRDIRTRLPGPRACAFLALLAVFLTANPLRASEYTAPQTRAPEHRHAVIRLNGDLDATKTFNEFTEAIATLAERDPKLILIELSGNRARPDLLFESLRRIRNAEVPVAVWLQDSDDRRVGPGMLGIALAADHAGIHPATSIKRDPDDALTHLNPDIGDWALVNLDLRSVARDLAESSGNDRLFYESALAPRSDLWIARNPAGQASLTSDEPPDPTRAHHLVNKDADGWSFEAAAKNAASLYHVAVHRTPRAFERSLGLRARPLETIEIESGLGPAHETCLTLIAQTRAGIGLADAAIDVRAGRAATSRTMPHEYHAAAEKAAVLVAPCREAIAEIARLTGAYPEILHLRPPPDDDAPTEIGGPSRTSLAAWRDAVRDAEYDLSRLDDRIESYRRR